ncbi:MAG: Wzz/FepE/Etk N-terminal domain-containing protein [Pseudomonadota bacterium]
MKEAAAVIMPLRAGDAAKTAGAPASEERDVAALFTSARTALRRNLGLLLLATLAGLAVGAALVALRQPVYTATAAIVIDPRLGDDGLGDQAPTIFLADALIVDSEVEVMRSERLMSRVAERLGLLEPGAQDNRGAVLDGLTDAIRIEREARTYVIRIRAQADSPEVARGIADAVADSYFAQRSEIQRGQARETGLWLSEEAARLSAALTEAERRVAAFMTAHDLTETREEDPVLRALLQLRAAKTDAERRISQVEAEAAALTAFLATAEADPAALAGMLDPALSDPTLTRLQTQLSDLLAQRSTLTDVAAATPIVARLAEALGTAIAQRAEARRQTAETLRREVALLDGRERALLARNALRQDLRIDLGALRREVGVLQAHYDALISREQAGRALAPLPGIPARLIERPVTPDRPSGPAPALVLATMAVAGLLVGLGLVFLREQLDDGMREVDGVTARTGLRCLGVVPQLNRRDVSALSAALPPWTRALPRIERRRLALAHAAQGNHCPDLIIALRRVLFALGIGKETTLRLGRDTPFRCVGVTALRAGEGKSFLAANLAMYLARIGHSVLLVDGDLGRRTLTRNFAGMVATDNAAPPQIVDASADLLRASLGPNLDLAFCAAPVADDEAGARSHAVLRALEATGHGCEIVVVDLPLAGPAADPPILAEIADDILLAAQWDRTPARALRTMLAQTPTLAGKLRGLILTQAKRPARLGRDFWRREATFG